MLGQFGGLGELEKFITVTIGVYLAGRLVRDPRNTRMVGIAAFLGTGAQLLMGTIVDICKVQFAVEDFEAVAGLPESVFATEGFAFLDDLLFSGIFFCLLPTLYLVPRLYGKIEPLLGMSPARRKPPPPPSAARRWRAAPWLLCAPLWPRCWPPAAWNSSTGRLPGPRAAPPLPWASSWPPCWHWRCWLL